MNSDISSVKTCASPLKSIFGNIKTLHPIDKVIILSDFTGYKYSAFESGSKTVSILPLYSVWLYTLNIHYKSLLGTIIDLNENLKWGVKSSWFLVLMYAFP